MMIAVKQSSLAVDDVVNKRERALGALVDIRGSFGIFSIIHAIGM